MSQYQNMSKFMSLVPASYETQENV